MTDKKIPTRIQDYLMMLGFSAGLSIGAIVIIVGVVLAGYVTSMIVWGLLQSLCFLVLALIRWQCDELLKHWGIVKEKKEEEKQ